MSYIMYQVKCQKCGEVYNTAFGIVGKRLIADPLKKCPACDGVVKKYGEIGRVNHAKTKPRSPQDATKTGSL